MTWTRRTELVEVIACARVTGSAKRAGHPYVIADGTLIPVDRVTADRPSCSGKHKKHGMNLQVIASPHGGILWVSGALPCGIPELGHHS